MTRMPDFFIVGAPKCGTTSLASWLRRHPAVYIPRMKEPNFYNTDIEISRVGDARAYGRLFRNAGGHHLAVGEASATYLLSRVAIPAIEREYDDPKYIVMLRNPVDMAYSLYLQNVRSGRERLPSFGEAWNRYAGRPEDGHRDADYSILLDYRKACALGEHLRFMTEIVPRERVLVLSFDDLRRDPREVYLSVLEFLGVPDDGRTEFPKENRGTVYPSATVARLFAAVHAFRRRLPIPPLGTNILERAAGAVSRKGYPELDEAVQEELRAHFRTEVEKLEALLGKTFPW